MAEVFEITQPDIEIGRDDISMLRALRDIINAFHRDARELQSKIFPDADSANNAATPLIVEFFEKYPLNPASLYESEIRVSGDGVLVPNINIMYGQSEEDDTKMIHQITHDIEKPVEPMEPFDSKLGMVTGVFSRVVEAEGGFRAVPALIIELKDKINLRFTLPGIESVVLMGGKLNFQVLAEMTDETTIEFPRIDEIDNYVRSIGSFAVKVAQNEELEDQTENKKFIDQIHRLHAAFYREHDLDFQDLRSIDRLRDVAKKCEEYVHNNYCTAGEVEVLLTTLMKRNRIFDLEGRVTGGLGRESEVVARRGKVLEVFIQQDEQDMPQAVLCVETRNDENIVVTESFIIKELESVRF